MFVIEDPAKRKSPRSKYLQQSQVRSHLASNYHKRRQRQQPKSIGFGGQSFVFCVDDDITTAKTVEGGELSTQDSSRTSSSCSSSEGSPDVDDDGDADHNLVVQLRQKQRSVSSPASIIDVGFTGKEGRTLQFFRERTAVEWPGWYDAEFWNVLALQAAHSHNSLKHALLSLGAYHESLEAKDETAKQQQIAFSLEQSQRAIATMIKDNAMSMSAILSTYTAISASSACLYWTTFWQATYTIVQIFDELEAQPSRVSQAEWMFISQYLKPMIERQRSRAGQYVDMLSCLKVTNPSHFYTTEPPSIPVRFTTLRKARDALESLLNWTTYMAKVLDLSALVIPNAAEELFDMWFQRLDQFSISQSFPQRDQCNISLLRACAKMGIMLIKTMHAEENDELIFDNFTSIYRELTDVFGQVLDYTESVSLSNVRFGIDGGMLALFGNIGTRWCRDPTVRRDIIRVLHRAQQREGVEDSIVWARVIEYTMYLEEAGISPSPQSAQDIPKEKRVRCLDISFYHRANIQHMRYHLAPYDSSPDHYKDIYTPHIVGVSRQGLAAETTAIRPGERPQIILGRGFTSWLVGDSQEYYTFHHPKFYFPLPKL